MGTTTSGTKGGRFGFSANGDGYDVLKDGAKVGTVRRVVEEEHVMSTGAYSYSVGVISRTRWIAYGLDGKRLSKWSTRRDACEWAFGR